MIVRADAERFVRECPSQGNAFDLEAKQFCAQPAPKSFAEYRQRQAAMLALTRSWSKSIGKKI